MFWLFWCFIHTIDKWLIGFVWLGWYGIFALILNKFKYKWCFLKIYIKYYMEVENDKYRH